MRKIILFISLLQVFSGWSQDSILVTKNFQFQDGLYASFGELKNNEPTINWEEVIATYFVNPRTVSTRVQELILKETGEQLSIENFFAVCVDGMPFIRLDTSFSGNSGFFSGLQVSGAIGYFAFEKTGLEKVKIQAYNPLNGQPFRSGFVEKEKVRIFEKILIWETGEQEDFTQENFLKHIESDKPLHSSVKDLKAWELEEKLFKSLLIYNDRHSIFTKRIESDK